MSISGFFRPCQIPDQGVHVSCNRTKVGTVLVKILSKFSVAQSRQLSSFPLSVTSPENKARTPSPVSTRRAPCSLIPRAIP